jgi:hypothetical protein
MGMDTGLKGISDRASVEYFIDWRNRQGLDNLVCFVLTTDEDWSLKNADDWEWEMSESSLRKIIILLQACLDNRFFTEDGWLEYQIPLDIGAFKLAIEWLQETTDEPRKVIYWRSY